MVIAGDFLAIPLGRKGLRSNTSNCLYYSYCTIAVLAVARGFDSFVEKPSPTGTTLANSNSAKSSHRPVAYESVTLSSQATLCTPLEPVRRVAWSSSNSAPVRVSPPTS